MYDMLPFFSLFHYLLYNVFYLSPHQQKHTRAIIPKSISYFLESRWLDLLLKRWDYYYYSPYNLFVFSKKSSTDSFLIVDDGMGVSNKSCSKNYSNNTQLIPFLTWLLPEMGKEQNRRNDMDKGVVVMHAHFVRTICKHFTWLVCVKYNNKRERGTALLLVRWNGTIHTIQRKLNYIIFSVCWWHKDGGWRLDAFAWNIQSWKLPFSLEAKSSYRRNETK